MASREDQVTSSTSRLNEDDHLTSRQLRAEINRTRAELDETFDALERKLTPRELLGEGWSLFKGGSSASANRVVRVARDYPLPSAVIGLGLGWLLLESSRSGSKARRQRYAYDTYGTYGSSSYGASSYGASSYGYEESEGRGVASRLGDRLSGVREAASGAAHRVGDAASGAAHRVGDAASGAAHRVGDVAHTAGERVSEAAGTVRYKASELGDRARYGARHARQGFWEMMEERPLAVGVATLALGLVAGLAMPSTRREDELFGAQRDQLLEKAQHVGSEALDRGKQVASVAVDRINEEAQREGLTPEGLIDKAKNVARETSTVVKDEARHAAEDLKNEVKPASSQQQDQTAHQPAEEFAHRS
jgi:hypothetical protein